MVKYPNVCYLCNSSSSGDTQNPSEDDGRGGKGDLFTLDIWGVLGGFCAFSASQIST